MKVGNKEKGLLINSVLQNINAIIQEINDNAKYYSPVWKKEMLQALKVEARAVLEEALAEVEVLNKQYEERISKVQNTPFSHSVNKDFLDTVNYTKTRLLAELKINPEKKDSILEMAVASKSGAQAVLELIDSKQIDQSYWTDDLYKKAFINSKSQAEIDFELKKESQIEAIRTEQLQAYNYGSYLAVRKLLDSNFDIEFDNEIRNAE
jgi:hypothetical protein